MIEVGEYVRTRNGKIRKVKDTVAQYYITDRLNILDNNQFEKEDIVKHSKNIIHLIEAGDYVNGNKVVQTYKDSKKQDEIYLEVVVSSIMIKEPLTDYIEENRIKTILTKEQYERNCYKVEE